MRSSTRARSSLVWRALPLCCPLRVRPSLARRNSSIDLAADGVEAARHLRRNPVGQRRVVLELELAPQRRGLTVRGAGQLRVLDPVVDEPRTQVRGVDPLRDRGGVLVRHQQRRAEAAQHALDGAFPRALVGVHLHQLAGEGQLVLFDAHGRAQARPNAEELRGDVGLSLLERVDLHRERLLLIAQRAEADGGLDGLLLERGQAGLGGRPQLSGFALVGEEALRVGGRGQARLHRHAVVALGAHLPLVLLPLATGEFLPQPLQPLTAVAGDVLLEPVALVVQVGAARAGLLEVDVQRGQLGGARRQSIAQQAHACLGEPGSEGVAAVAVVLHLRGERVVGIAVGHQRLQPAQLVLRLEHRLVGAGEVVDVGDEAGDALLHREGLQHVLAHEVGEVADGLHRDRLVEEVERLIILDAEALAERGLVRREGVVHFLRHWLEAPAQLGHVGDVGEVLGDGECLISHHAQARRLAFLLLHPEDLREGDVLLVALVEEVGEQHRIAVLVAQGDGARGASGVAAFGLVVPEEVRAGRALAGLGAGGLVVGDAPRLDEQRGERVDHRRFAGADVAGQQRRLAARVQVPDLLVEGAPVEQLQAVEPEASAFIGRGEVEQVGLGAHEATSLVVSAWAR